MISESVENCWNILVHDQNNDPTLKQNLLEEENCQAKDLANPNAIEDTYLQTEKGGIYSQGTKYQVVENIYKAGFSDCYIELLERFQAQAYMFLLFVAGNYGNYWLVIKIQLPVTGKTLFRLVPI